MQQNLKIIVFGTGSFARLIYTLNKQENLFDIIAFTVHRKYKKASTFMDLPVADFEEIEKHYSSQNYGILMGVGYSEMRSRKEIFKEIQQKGYKLPNYISKNADVGLDVKFGSGNIIFNDVHIGSYGKMEDNNIIRQKTYLGHDFILGSHNIISPGCTIGGRCKVDNLCFVALGSTVINKIHLAQETLVGAGSLLLKDTKPYSMYIGHPAKLYRKHKETGIIVK